MFDFLQSSATNAFFSYILAAAYASTLLTVILLLINQLFGNARPKLRRLLSLSTLLLIPLLPALSSLYPQIGLPSAPIEILHAPIDIAEQATAQPTPATSTDSPPQPPHHFQQTVNAPKLWHWLSALYLLGVLFFSLRLILGLNRIRNWSNASRPITEPKVLDAFATAQDLLKLRSPCFLLASDTVSMPIAVGVFNYRILLPASIIEALNHEELMQLAVHETAHIKRCDPVIFGLIALLRIFFYWNPLFWFASRSFLIAAEQSADHAVIEATANNQSYTHFLIKMAEKLSNPFANTELAAGIILNKSVFIRRAEALLETRIAPWRQSKTLGLFAGACFLGGLHIALAHPLTTKSQDLTQAATEQTQPVPTPSSSPVQGNSVQLIKEQLGLTVPVKVVDYGSRYLNADRNQKATYVEVADREGNRLLFCLSRGHAADFPGSWYLNGQHPSDAKTRIVRGSQSDQALRALIHSWLMQRHTKASLQHFLQQANDWGQYRGDQLMTLRLSELLDTYHEFTPH